MNAVRPRSLAHRGSVEAAGLLFDLRTLSVESARLRILACWSNGATVYRVKNGLLLRLPTPKRIACDRAAGTPLALQSGCLVAAPLSSAEISALAAPQNSLISLQNGIAVIEPLLESAKEYPAAWISLEGWRAMHLLSLGVPPMPPRLVAEPAKFDPRSRLPGVPPESPQRAEAVKALRLALSGAKPEDTSRGSLRQTAAHLLQSLAKRLRERRQTVGRLHSVSGRGSAPAGSREVSTSPALLTPPGPGLMDRLAEQMNHLAARLLMASGLSEQLGRKQAAYMKRMMEMFERGELDEGLRHAIGLSEMETDRPLPPLLRTPTPRSDLTLSAVHPPPRATLNTDAELAAHLRAMYRKAFEKLEAEGRIDEAAFVLAELLSANEEAVAFLERHGKVSLAAEMAEARNLPPGLVIRLWFLVGNHERAAQIARRTGAFADAVHRMARVDSAKAEELRMFWAASLALAGDYVGAIEALWPEAALRPLTLEWMDKVLALGGPVAAAMLARKLVIAPEDNGVREQARSLLEDELTETIPQRFAFCAALRAHTYPTSSVSALARLAVRAVLRDAGQGYSNVHPADFQSLLRLADDAVLRADVPAVPVSQSGGLISPAGPACQIDFTVQAADTGILPVCDAALLPGGQALIALGEAGARLVSRDGRVIVHFEQPAHRLVLSDNGARAILLAPRGEAWRMAKLDLASRRVEPWREAIFRAFATDYDGALWFVSIDNDLTAIDAVSAGFDALWQMPRLEGRVVSLTRSQQQCSFLLYQRDMQDAYGNRIPSEARQERWTYALPSLVLRDRNEVPMPSPSLVSGENLSVGMTAEGGPVYLTTQQIREQQSPAQEVEASRLTASDPIKGTLFEEVCPQFSAPLPPVFSGTWAVLSTRTSSGIICRLLDRKDWKVRARFTLEGAASVSARVSENTLTLGDNRGRLLALDLQTGELLRNLRMR